jgi:uncharacterized damage-inducible protein DinB
MNIGESLAMELEMESRITRKVLESLPEDKFEWKPHEKSMQMSHLASHLVTNIGWTFTTINEDGLDFAAVDFEPEIYETKEDMLKKFDENVAGAAELLRRTTDEDILKEWVMRNGEKVYFSMAKSMVVKSFVINHGIHHRAQLAMYLRLLDVPVPQIYGPTADFPDM